MGASESRAGQRAGGDGRTGTAGAGELYAGQVAGCERALLREGDRARGREGEILNHSEKPIMRLFLKFVPVISLAAVACGGGAVNPPVQVAAPMVVDTPVVWNGD